MPLRTPLSLALLAAIHALPAAAAPGAADDLVKLPAVEVRAASRHAADASSPPETERGRLLVGKKATRIDLDKQPAVVQANYRQLLAQAPGLLVSEQPIPSHYNLNYRGLGDPHESEFVMVAVDGTPVHSDWFGYSTLYFSPPSEQIRRIDFLRGGSSLLYGPQPGPVIDLVRRGPRADAPFAGQARLLAGSDGLRAGYAEASGGSPGHGWFLSANRAESDGRRRNADATVEGVRGAWVWQPDAHGSWEFDLTGFRSNSGEPGRLTAAQYAEDPDQTVTPTNRVWIDRIDLSVAHQREVGSSSALSAKAFHWYQDRYSRRASPQAAGAPPPASTTFDRQQFRVSGLDARVLTEWGASHSLTWGTTLYHSDSPRSQARSTNLLADRGEDLRFRQERENRYGALFVENAFRIGEWTLVPALRQEWLEMSIEEPVKLASLQRPAIDRTFSRSETLLGFGATRTLGERWRVYGNASQGYRPMRYDDIGNPTAELGQGNEPDPARAENFELGIRGVPAAGWEIDVSLFRVDLDDKIEQQTLSPTDILRVNSGDARHQGLEFSVSRDLLAASDGGDQLIVFANGSLLDAEIVRSRTASLVGNTPAYAPERVFRAGLLWRTDEGRRVALTGAQVSEHFWQDNNLGTATLPATIEGVTLWDLAVEWPVGDRITLTGGVNNLTDEKYSNRIRGDGIEVAPRRQVHAGVTLAF